MRLIGWDSPGRGSEGTGYGVAIHGTLRVQGVQIETPQLDKIEALILQDD